MSLGRLVDSSLARFAGLNYGPDGAGMPRIATPRRATLTGTVALTMLLGRTYRGQPVLGVVLQEFNNHAVSGEENENRIASYGNAFSPGYDMEVTD